MSGKTYQFKIVLLGEGCVGKSIKKNEVATFFLMLEMFR